MRRSSSRPQAARRMALGWSGAALAPGPRSRPATVEASWDADVSGAPLGIAGAGGRAPRCWPRLGSREASRDAGQMDKLRFYLRQTGTGSIEEPAAAPSEPGPFARGRGLGPWGHPGAGGQLCSHAPTQQLQGRSQPPNDTFSISTSER